MKKHFNIIRLHGRWRRELETQLRLDGDRRIVLNGLFCADPYGALTYKEGDLCKNGSSYDENKTVIDGLVFHQPAW